MRVGAGNGSGFRTRALTIEKIAVFAPMQSASVSRAMGVNPRSLHRRRPAYLTSPATPAEIRMIHESPELLGLVTGNACLSLIVDGGRACCLPKNAGLTMHCPGTTAMGVNPRSLHRRRPAYLTSPATPAEIRMIHESPELLGLVTGNACLSLIVDGGRACCLPKNAGLTSVHN